MSTILISGLQNRVKNSSAYAEELGMMMIANGEELPYLLTVRGEKVTAGIIKPVVAPTISSLGAGAITTNKYAIYTTVFVGENSFPLVAARIYSNPGPYTAPYHYTNASGEKVALEVYGSTDTGVSHVYIFRTALFDTSALAQTAADAGLLNYVGKIANTPGSSGIFQDNLVSAIGNEQIQLVNFSAPQFRFVVWDGSYFWGFGNHPFRASASWTSAGVVTLQNPSVDIFYNGRDNQFITLQNVTTGGIDGRGTFLFKRLTNFTGQVINEAGANMTIPTASSGDIVIIGPTATLYRSGYRNPFQWGYLSSLAGTYIPILWQYKVSGALGTAIAIVPDQQLLKLDTEFPASCVTFNLQSAATDVFIQSKRLVSKLYSVTSHFSQFTAISKGRQVLWGMDYKNLAIVESDGYNQIPVSGPISVLLRNLSKNRSLHLVSHGLYDPSTEINAMWLSTAEVDKEGAQTNFDICVYQHAPTGFWGVFSDYGVSCSAVVEDSATSQRTTLVGTDNGFIGKAFDVTASGNWLPGNSPFTGFANSGSEYSITRSEGQDDFDPEDAGLIGNFCTIVNSEGLKPQIRRITSVTSDTLFFDTALNPIPTTTDDPGLVDGQFKFYVGLIELRMLKYFDEGEPSTDKVPREFWATLEDCETPTIEFYPEHSIEPIISLPLKQDGDSDTWFNKTDFPTKKGKSFGIALVERSYNQTVFHNFTLK